MMRSLCALTVVLSLIACSFDKPAPVAPAGKAADFDEMFDVFNRFQEEQKVLGGINRLTYGPGSKRAPEWSPDGQSIIFYIYTSRTGWDVYTIAPDGSNETQLTTHETGESSPKFSPDGFRIMFTSGRSGRASVHVMDADGQNEVRLTGGNSSEEYHVWSPDGQRILYVSSPWNGDDYENGASMSWMPMVLIRRFLQIMFIQM